MLKGSGVGFTKVPSGDPRAGVMPVSSRLRRRPFLVGAGTPCASWGERRSIQRTEGDKRWGRHAGVTPQFEKWSGRPDSNRRPPAPKAGALPGCATSRGPILLGLRGSNSPAWTADFALAVYLLSKDAAAARLSVRDLQAVAAGASGRSRRKRSL